MSKNENRTDTVGENIEGVEPDIEPTETTDEATVHDEGVQLERTIELKGGLSIGIGTMIGAGIFVFPGLAAEQAGPAATVSFGIGAVVALLVALPTSELATAMPRSGGGYYFVSRSMGAVFGAIIGLGLWLGLVFASAFYLVGFGFYAEAVLQEAGIALDVNPVKPLALAFGVFLVSLSIVGTENVTKLQNLVVGVLLLIIFVFLGYGSLDALGLFGGENVPENFFSKGAFDILETAALVFTSYLGFAQVATVAGEIKKPSRNLPLAMVGSVLTVGFLYIVTIFVATSAFGSTKLGQFGETAMVEVSRNFFGLGGAIAILIAGLLATVSSANASILSSSRAVFALSKDALIPRRASDINLKYGTPHIALALAGGPILVLIAVGPVEILAEVASFLHLVMYALMCFAVIVLRRSNPEWYDPSFRMPGYPVLPIIGGVASIALIPFMNIGSIIIGVGVMAVSLVWYLYYARDVNLKGVL